MERLTGQQGCRLLQLARAVLQKKINDTGEIPQIEDPLLFHKRGTFVTLKLNNQLRGCIGNIEPVKSIVTSVSDNAVNAALYDHRFSPLSGAELEEVVIGVSILTAPQKLEYRDVKDLTAKLRPHRDGVILAKGMRSATFLPQVWEQLADTEAFLTHLCLKAGLAADCWREQDVDIQVYQVQKFEEDHK